MKLVPVLAGVLATTVASATFFLTIPADAAPKAGAVSPSEAISAATVQVVRDGVTLLDQRTPVSAKAVTGHGATRSDFDGDGIDDIAAFANGAQGGVTVTYSSAPVRDYLSTEMVGLAGCVCFGTEMTTGNFNGDKYDDLAIGDLSEGDVKQKGRQAGAVWIFPGGPGGLQVDAVKHVNQSTPGAPGTSADGDWFGSALAAGDITGDGRDELLVGLPDKKVAGQDEAGAVVVLKGSSAGIVTSGAKWIDQNTSGVPGAAETTDHFGSAIAVGKLDKNKYRDVVIGSSGEDAGGSSGSGLVTQFWGSSAGVSFKKVTAVSAVSAAAAAQRKDTYLSRFGAALAIADTNGDGHGEVIVGDEDAQVGRMNGGVVVSLTARSTGLSIKKMIILSRQDKNIAGTPKAYDGFGESIAAGDVTGDGIADVLVGVPGADVGKAKDAGSVVLLRGSSKGLTGSRSQTLTQSSAGVPNTPEHSDAFGSSVSLLNLNGAGGLDAVIGAPGETVTGDSKGFPSGTVTKLIGSGKGLGSGVDVSGRSLGLPGQSYGYLVN